MLIMLRKNTRNNIHIGGMRVCERDQRLNESIQRERRYSQIRDYLMTCICLCDDLVLQIENKFSVSISLSLSLSLSLVYKSLTSFSIPANKKMFKYNHSLWTHLQILMLINKYKSCAINTVNQ